MMILSEFVLIVSPSPATFQDAVVLRRIGTASLIELRGRPARASAAQATSQMHPATAFASISSSARGSRFSGNPEFCIHHGMFATSYSDLPYETAPLAADGFHLRILKVPAADLRPSQADLVKAGLGDLVPKPFCEHGALVPLLASCFRDLKETDDASEPERARSLVQTLAQLALIERGLIRPGSRAALHALRVGRLSLARRLIARNISRAALSPALVADLLGISVRHLHILFEATDTSFAQTVTAERLAESRRLLIAAPGAVDFGYRAGLRLQQPRDILSRVPGGPRHVAGRVSGQRKARSERIATATQHLAR